MFPMESTIIASLLLSLVSVYNTVSENGEGAFFALRKAEAPNVKGIYWTANTAGYQQRREDLIRFIKNTELNSVVIDVKDSTGRIFIKTGVPMAEMMGSEDLRIAPDMENLLKRLRKENIYSIARIAVFQDPFFAEKIPDIALKKSDGNIWRDKKGLAWVDPSSLWVWKYNLDIANAAIRLGFDEVNFDYIRFPSDGNISEIQYRFDEKKITKNYIIANFFKYISENVKWYQAYTSVDVFGMTLWRKDGLGIGQRYEDAFDYIDFICPMVYPSHYYANFEGFANPAEYPYEIVYKSLIKSKENFVGKRAFLRPWLQDFDMGAMYDKDKIRKQIQASYDAGARGWLLWNASNSYTQDAMLTQ